MITLVYRYFRAVMIFVLNDDDGMTRLLYVYEMMRIVYVWYDLMKLLYRAYIWDYCWVPVNSDKKVLTPRSHVLLNKVE